MRTACTTVQTQLSLDPGTDVYGIFIYNLDSFLFYLSASDGMISHHEVNFINDNFGASFTAQEIRQMIIDGNLYSHKFENKLPESFSYFIAMDRLLKERGVTFDQGTAMTMLDVFEAIGREFLASDGNVSEEEVKNFNIYITNLKQHIDEEEHKDENVPFPADEGRAAASPSAGRK